MQHCQKCSSYIREKHKKLVFCLIFKYRFFTSKAILFQEADFDIIVSRIILANFQQKNCCSLKISTSKRIPSRLVELHHFRSIINKNSISILTTRIILKCQTDRHLQSFLVIALHHLNCK